MAELGWLDKAERPRKADQLRALSHEEFEAFAFEVVRCLYEPQGIILRRTGTGPDGGRDGEAAMRIGVVDKYAVELLLWLEVKHHKARVGRKASGSHLVAAMNAAANILVLVSSSGFSRPFRSEVEQFSLRTGMRAVLIDGVNLIAIADELRRHRAAPGGDPVALPSVPAAPTIRVRAVHFAVSAAQGGDSSARSLPVDRRTPVFAVVQYEFRLGSGCCNIDVDIDCAVPGVEVRTISSRTVLSAGADERLNSIVLIRGRPGVRISSSDLRVCAVTAREGEPRCEASASWQPEPGATAPEVEFIAPQVEFQPTEDQRAALSQARDAYARWKRKGGVVSLSIEAAAGVGKSAVLRELRWSWLEDGVREIVVDGAIENSVWSLFSAILAHLLPTDGALARTFDVRSVRERFEQLSAPPPVATRLARAICGKVTGHQSFSPGELEDVLAAMLRKLAVQGPLCFVYEDLHKVGGGVLRLLHATRERLRAERNVQILFCLTSRFQAQGTTAEASIEGWALERERLLGDEQAYRLRLDTPSEGDARAILEGAIPYLYPEVADLMIDRAGTTPFSLTELIHFLLERRCLERVGTPEVLRVTPSADLKSELRRPELIARTATDQRLALIAERLTPAGRDLLDAAACLGREFDPDLVLRKSGSSMESEDAVDALLGGLFRDGILGPAPRSFGNRWRFEHDIIREAVLRRLAAPENRPRHLRLLRRLDPEDGSWPPPVALALSYQSGDGDAFIARAKNYASEQQRAGYPYEAAFCLALENYVTDPLAPPAAFEDAAYRASPRPLLSKAATAAALLDTKKRLYEASVLVTGAAGEFAKRIITEVRMLSERLGDVAGSAMALRWEGDLWIAQGEDRQAVDCYREAERLYSRTPTRVVDLFQTVLGQGIALRLLGETDQSAAELQRALALSPDDPFAQIRYHANYGALFFYSDAGKRRKHWEEALSIAERAGFEDLQVHMDGDVAGLDIMEDRPDVRARVERLMEVAVHRRLDDSLVRALIMASAIDLLEGKPDAALSRLDEARRLGYANDTKRRLWKIHANSAIAHEEKGDLDRAYEEDRVMLGVLSAVAWERRIALAPANITLRARDHPTEARYDALSRSIGSAARPSVDAILAAVDTETPLIGRFPQEHLRRFRHGPRFIAV
ncbi:MAG: eukaryotic-like serine/threonine-protein kinase [Sphingomonadales bacterium]|nr:eukaryotic-like serine/threonine-protein kinase [Sphingomonadales bacterium]